MHSKKPRSKACPVFQKRQKDIFNASKHLNNSGESLFNAIMDKVFLLGLKQGFKQRLREKIKYPLFQNFVSKFWNRAK